MHVYIHYHTIIFVEERCISICMISGVSVLIQMMKFVVSLECAIECYIGNIFNIIGSHVNIPGMVQQGLLSS